MRLAALPDLPSNLVSGLEQCGIRTEADLLFSGSTLDVFRRLPAETTTLKELAKLMALVAEAASAPGQSAAALVEADVESDCNNDFLSGLPQLDQALSGLTAPRRLIEVSGNKGSGKTSLLLRLVLHHLVFRPQSSVLWVDTTVDFSVVRAGEILDSFGIPGASTALERLQVCQAFEVDTVFQVLEDMSTWCISHPTKIRAVVVDSVTSLLGPLLSPVSSQGHAIMTGFMRQLRVLAQTYCITVFVVNNSAAFTPLVPGSASNNPNIRKPALGPSFTFMTDATLWLALCRETAYAEAGALAVEETECTKHVVQVYRSKITASKPLCTFKMRRGIILLETEG
ncbi:P-loop containing nucleoside triphosphate hydrolase protein, partial [Mycena pura]